MNDFDQVVSLALCNPKFRQQLLDDSIDNKEIFKKYGIKPTAEVLKLDKKKLLQAIEDKLGDVAWCIGNACGAGA